MNADSVPSFSPSQYSALPSLWVVHIAVGAETIPGSYREIFAIDSTLRASVTEPRWRASSTERWHAPHPHYIPTERRDYEELPA
jgi:hypothetical protein